MSELDDALLAANQDPAKGNEFYRVFFDALIFVPTGDRGVGEESAPAAALEVVLGDKRVLPIFDGPERLMEAMPQAVGYLCIQGHTLLASHPSDVYLLLNPGTDFCKEFSLEEVQTLQAFLREAMAPGES
jgi:hypothetical protein